MDLKEAKELIEKIVLEDEISKPGILNEFILECLEATQVSLFDKDFDLDEIYFDATEGPDGDVFEFGGKTFRGEMSEGFWISQFTNRETIPGDKKQQQLIISCINFNLKPIEILDLNKQTAVGSIVWAKNGNTVSYNVENYFSHLRPISHIIKKYALGYNFDFLNWQEEPWGKSY